MPRAFSYLILSHLKQNPGHASATRHAQRCVCQFFTERGSEPTAIDRILSARALSFRGQGADLTLNNAERIPEVSG